ncbi:MAG: ATP-binding cassette domain-containing protein [Spirochaetales bacterium]|nr:ATP-binding cassette domain-containing protein [Spirochaetales bacterium]
MRKLNLLTLGKDSVFWTIASAMMLFLNGLAYIFEILFIAGFIGSIVNGQIEKLPRLLLMLAFILVVKAAASFIGNICSSQITLKVKHGVRSRIFDKVKRLGPAYVNTDGTAELVANTLDGVEALEVFFGRFIPQLIYSLVIPIVLFAFTFRIYPAFAIVLLAAVPVIPMSMMFISKWAARSMSGFWDDYQGLSSIFLENLQGIVTLKLFNKSEKRLEEMSDRAWDFRNSTMALLRMQLTSITVMDTLVYGFAGLGIFLAVRGFYIGKYTINDFFILLMLSVEFFLPIRKLGSFFHAGVNGIQAGKKITAFLKSPEKVREPKKGLTPDGSDIVLKDLVFSYNNHEREIFSGLSYEFKAGGIYGVFGSSGCGKSTLGRLLLRFFDPDSGSVTFGGVSLSDIPLAELRQKITLVEARSRIFSGTIEDNLKLAAPKAMDSEMLNACEMAGLLNDSAGLKKETGEGGSRLSGGERQRLAIARAILMNPDVFIFDEAAGSVDAESEEIIKNTIHSLPEGKTVIIISHRMSMLEGVENVFSIKDGKIVNAKETCNE